jgi:hypothetical protein
MMPGPVEEVDWLVSSAGTSIRLVWRRLGRIQWTGSAIVFPGTPHEPGVYLIRVALGQASRAYIGEAADIRRRLSRYGGRAEERPNQRGVTDTNMRGRLTRTFRAGGEAVIYLLQLPLSLPQGRECFDPQRKDCRIMLERLAISAAYLRGEELINEEGFPSYPEGHPLQ